MTERARIKDVAAAARVSAKTVSRVLNNVSTVDPAMRRRVERAIAALDYVPSPTARSLRTGSAAFIGLVVDAIDDPFFAALAGSVEDCALQAGMDVMVASTRFDVARERQQLLRLLGQRPRGIIFAPVATDLEYLAASRGGVPMITIDRPVNALDGVVVDDYPAARHGVEVLIASQHTRIALLGYDPRFETSRLRRKAYEDALHAAGITLDSTLVPDVPLAGDAARCALDEVLALPDPPTALFLANARHATTIVSAVHELGRTELAMVSFGDFTLAAALRPAVTCINQDPCQMGLVAFERLMELADHPDSRPATLTVPTTFVERTSHALMSPLTSLPRPARSTTPAAQSATSS